MITAALFTVLLGAAPVCITAPLELDARLGNGWRGLLEKRLGRRLESSELCEGDHLELTACDTAVCVRYASSPKERRVELPDHDAADALALMVTGLIADTSPSRRAGDLTPLPPLVTPPPEPKPTPAAESASEFERTIHPLATLGSGVGFQKGFFTSSANMGVGFRVDQWSITLEVVQLGLFEPAEASRMWMTGLVVWHSFEISARWAFDAGVGIGLVGDGAIWYASSVSGLGIQSRFLGRPTFALTSWLSAHARFEFGLSSALNSSNPPSSHAAIQLGLEARF